MSENENKSIDPKLQEALTGIWNSLTDEQKEKAKQCKTMEELAAIAGREGIELPDEILDAVAGGNVFKDTKEWLGIQSEGSIESTADAKAMDSGC